ncbi:uncharacterized protein MONOS_18589 [Monocercomonoides exilis]|uniref:uncharacterized protein n=1 Tax=Monocercomonoides exilis TaxID=2049356 RepID=UPI00355A611C|nr:hypothetical protein MONOS_18589 [Monocercomonoides exilis]
MSTQYGTQYIFKKQTMSVTKRLSELLHELERCRKNEQMQKIKALNGLIDGMDEEELKYVFTKDLFDKIHQMIEKKKMSMEYALLLLKHIGYCKVLKRIWIDGFKTSSLNKRFEQMIIEEDERKEGRNEKLLVDLCECYVSLSFLFSSELILICGSCLLKVSLKKDEDEEAQKEVEMALLALSNIGVFNKVKRELFLDEIKEIIVFHQEHRNLTQLAFQSAWDFLTNRLFYNANLEEVIVNELHFVREARREMEELMKCVDWERKKGEEKGKEAKEEFVLMRWLRTLGIFLFYCRLQNEKFFVIIESIVQVYRAAKDNYREIGKECVCSLGNAVRNRAVEIDDLLESGAIDSVLKEIQQTTNENFTACICLEFFLKISERLKGNSDDEMEDEKRKDMKRKVLEKLEEEGYEDGITCLNEKFDFLNRKYYDELSLDISDYFVNV